MSETFYCDVSKISLKRISKNVAKDIIVKNHYSHTWSLCQVSYGIFYNDGESNGFLEDDTGKLIGCIVYASPVGRSAAASISDAISINDVFELVRLWVADGYGKNVESYCITQSFKLLNRDYPNIKAVISYSDCEQGHRGIIYQATGFLYQGRSSLALMANYSISLIGPPYKWMHSRTVSETYGSHNVEHIKKCIGKTFWRKKESTKHRYLYFICGKIEKKRLLKTIKHPFLPYPKETIYIDEIEEIKVENNVENEFFG